MAGFAPPPSRSASGYQYTVTSKRKVNNNHYSVTLSNTDDIIIMKMTGTVNTHTNKKLSRSIAKRQCSYISYIIHRANAYNIALHKWIITVKTVFMVLSEWEIRCNCSFDEWSGQRPFTESTDRLVSTLSFHIAISLLVYTGWHSFHIPTQQRAEQAIRSVQPASQAGYCITVPMKTNRQNGCRRISHTVRRWACYR